MTWYEETLERLPDEIAEKIKKPVIIFVCSNGHESGLLGWDYKNHTVAPDGTVSPSVVCTYTDCTFHEFIKLIDYPAKTA